MTRSVVVLPQPDGPSRLTSSPAPTSRSMPSRPTTPLGNRFERVSRVSSASRAIAGLGRLGRVHPEDDAALLAGVAEGVGERALEGKTVALAERVGRRIDA